MVIKALNFISSGPGLTPGRGCCVVFLAPLGCRNGHKQI